MHILTEALGAAFLLAVTFSSILLLWRRRRRSKIQPVVAFFHPFTNDGGGGERVLWCAVRAIQETALELRVAVYTVDPANSESLAARALALFGVDLLDHPESLGSMVLACEALNKLTPFVFIDTSGYAFTYVLARIAGSFVACYTHYPTVSTDTGTRVFSQAPSYNNSANISGSFWLSMTKVEYYRLLAKLFGWAGRCAHVAMVNPSWTYNHIDKLWNKPNRTFLVYPPCDTWSLQASPLIRPLQVPYIISLAQFRPEKAHTLQPVAFAKALEKLSCLHKKARLKLMGRCRVEDEEMVESLKQKCQELGLQHYVDFCLNVSHRELAELLGGAIAGLHTMTDEHFGISIVEYMAAGAVPIAHNSAGPKLDIVVNKGGQQTGFPAISSSDFAEAMCDVLTMPNSERLNMAEAARLSAARFSESRFDAGFTTVMGPLLEKAARGICTI